MRNSRTNKVYVKGFKITNSNNTFTEEDFIQLQEKLKVIRKLYLRPEVGCDCYVNFRTITKEIKRAAHNAALKTKILHLDYTCLSKNEISISGDSTMDVNLLVFIKPVPELKGDNFTISTKYIYKGENSCVL